MDDRRTVSEGEGASSKDGTASGSWSPHRLNQSSGRETVADELGNAPEGAPDQLSKIQSVRKPNDPNDGGNCHWLS